jgi:hypothetical protein
MFHNGGSERAAFSLPVKEAASLETVHETFWSSRTATPRHISRVAPTAQTQMFHSELLLRLAQNFKPTSTRVIMLKRTYNSAIALNSEMF